MTAVSLFRRYKRWNPVHPTYGAFWGVGVGFGCGVGWGPGFGPECVGFVGAGCGLGFSVGLTFLGLGIGLPAGGLTSLPCNAFSCVLTEIVEFAKFSAPLVAATTQQGFHSLASSAEEKIRSNEWAKQRFLFPTPDAFMKDKWVHKVSKCRQNLKLPIFKPFPLTQPDRTTGTTVFEPNSKRD